MVRLDRRLLSRAKPSLLRFLAGAVAAVSGSFAAPFAAADEGAPRLNAVGRFFGFGYSQHGYHSGYGRPGSAHAAGHYPSQQLTQIYLPAHYAMPQTRMPAVGQFHSPGAMPTAQQPKPAPEVPVGPPPKWLEPYLKGQAEQLPSPSETQIGEPSPSDRQRGSTHTNAAEEIDLLGVGESPYDTELIPTTPNSRLDRLPQPTPGERNQLNLPSPDRLDNGAPVRNDDLLDDDFSDDELLDYKRGPLPNSREGSSSSDDDDLLGADARYRYRYRQLAPTTRSTTAPTTQSTMHLYTPFR